MPVSELEKYAEAIIKPVKDKTRVSKEGPSDSMQLIQIRD